MRIHLLFLLLFEALNVQAQQDAKPLYPFRDGKYWGFSDERGTTMIVPATFELTEVMRNGQHIGYTSDDRIILFDAAGKVTDTVNEMYTIGMRVMYIRLTDDYYEGMQKMKQEYPLFASMFSNPGKGGWKPLEATGWIIDSAGNRIDIPETIYAIQTDVGILRLRNENGETGIYDMQSGGFMIPMQRDSIKYVEPGYFVRRKEDGSHYLLGIDSTVVPLNPKLINVTGIYEKKYFALPAGPNETIYYYADGKLVFDETSVVTFLYDRKNNKVIGGAERAVRGNNVFTHVYSLSGKKIAIDAYSAEHVHGNSVLVDFLDTVNRRFNYNMRVVDIETGKTLLAAPQPYTEIKKQGNFLIIDNKEKAQKEYYDYAGRLLMRIPYSVHEGHKPWEFYRDIALSHRTGWGDFRSAVYLALRDDWKKPFTVYGPDGEIVNAVYDTVSEYQGNYVIVKRGGKWGLMNAYWKELMPPVYDSFATTGIINRFIVKKGGKVYTVDSTGKPLAGHEADGVAYKTYKTPNGKILSLSVKGHSSAHLPIELKDPKTGDVKTLPYDNAWVADSTMPLVISVRSDNRNEGIFSALDLSEIRPLGFYTNLRATPIHNPPKGMKKGVMISGIGYSSSGDKYEIGGFYSVDGVKYWKD